MGKKAIVDDLSDILGDIPSTSKGATMGTKQEKAAAAKAAIAASAAKHSGKKDKPSKPAPAAKPAAKAAAKKPAAKRAAGKFHFPVGSPEREALKKRVLALVKKKAISTKDAAKELEAETWQVRLVAVDLSADKSLKMEKDGNAFTLKAR